MPQHYAQTMRAFAAERPRRAILTWLGSGVAAALWLGWFFLAGVNVHAMSDEARLEVAEAPSGVDAPLAGEVLSSALVLGAEVTKGDVLLEFDARREKLQLQEEELRLKATQTKIAALDAEIAARQTALRETESAARDAREAARARARETRAAADFAAEEEKRIGRLAADGVSPRVAVQKAASERKRLEATAAALDADIGRIDGEAKAKANAAQADIERLNFEARELAGDIQSSEAAIARLSLEIERHVLRAGVSGKLADVASLHGGSYVPEGQRLGVIVPKGEVQVIAEFQPSPVLGRVREGQHAELHLDGFPWSQYGVLTATVRRVDSEVRDGRVRVELDLDTSASASPIIQHGLPGSVTVNVERVTPAILLLRAAGVMLAGSPAEAATPERAP
ncbi:MAG: HlyD family efflux transporter periplasmic adaptor subunit [Aestuariivirga sp.]|nr:HlyD family efflux transporter periplasmic adaptor subunit [Aestuariivirga sp.]